MQGSNGGERPAQHDGLLWVLTGIPGEPAARWLIAQVDDLDRVAFANRLPGPKIDLIGASHRRAVGGGESIADNVMYRLRMRRLRPRFHAAAFGYDDRGGSQSPNLIQPLLAQPESADQPEGHTDDE